MACRIPTRPKTTCFALLSRLTFMVCLIDYFRSTQLLISDVPKELAVKKDIGELSAKGEELQRVSEALDKMLKEKGVHLAMCAFLIS